MHFGQLPAVCDGCALTEIAPIQAAGRSDRRVPAVVIGGELNGLGVCRSLSKGGVPIWVIDCKRSNPALWSRYARPVLTDSLHGPGFVRFLREFSGRMGEPPFLVITDEMALLTISEHRKELEGLYRFSLPAHDTVLMLHDKARFHESAITRGWPTPNGVIVRDAADLGELARLRLPIILKPADKRHFHEGRAPRLIVSETYPDAASAAEKLLAQAGELLAQETVEGPDENIHFCLFYRGRNGQTLGMFTGRKLASAPPGVGSTALCTPAASVSEELEGRTRRILDEVSYFGFGGIEFKRDARTGRYLIIEPTVGRTDWQEEAATLAGVNVPLIAYRHELGLPSLPAVPIDGRVVWQCSWIERIRFGAKPIPPGSVVVDGFWRRDDPLPALVHYPRNLAHVLGWRVTPYLARLRRRFGRPRRPTGFWSKV
jgi:predicted ATP-grasp superfamily ATP-dependent carboligase